MLLAPYACPEVNVAIRVNNAAEAHILLFYASCACLLRCMSIAPVGIILRIGKRGVSVRDENIGPVDVIPHLEMQVL